MKCFSPLITHSSPSHTALHFMPRKSEPAPGSVIAMQSRFSPLMVGSKNCVTCSPSQAARMLSGRCAHSASANEVRPNSFSMSITDTASKPPPPTSSGRLQACSPNSIDCFFSTAANSGGSVLVRSSVSSCGSISCSTKLRVISTSIFCSSVRLKSIICKLCLKFPTAVACAARSGARFVLLTVAVEPVGFHIDTKFSIASCSALLQCLHKTFLAAGLGLI